MNWFIGIPLAFSTALAGLFCGAFIGDKFARWFNVPNAEGAQAYYAVGVALLGAFLGFVLGLIVIGSLSPQNGIGYLKAAGAAAGGAVGLASLVLLCGWLLADLPPRLDGRPLSLEAEFQLPANLGDPRSGLTESYFELHQVSAGQSRTWRYGELDPTAAHQHEGRWIVPGAVEIFSSRDERALNLVIHGKSLAKFPIPLAAKPRRDSLEWSEWRSTPADASSPWAGDTLLYRFRVQLVAPPPRPLSSDEYAAKAAAAKQAAAQATFDAIPPDAPVVEQLALTAYGTPQAFRTLALERMRARPTFVAEMRTLITGNDHETAAAALRIIPDLPQPAPDLLDPVALAGRDIARRLRAVNELTRAQDPSYEGAATISIRFSAWMSAVHTLREKSGGDFTPELGEILELSRVRPDSIALRSDVCRVASFYMHEWAGLAPLPDDPKPR